MQLAYGHEALEPAPESFPAPKHLAIAAMATAAAAIVWRGHLVGVLDDIVATALLALAALANAMLPSLDGALADLPMAPLIALVGCDGSGKTTLSGDLLARLAADRPASGCYLGLGSGALGERIKALPMIGRVAERKLARKAKQARTEGAKIPGLPTALVIYVFSLLRLRRFRLMLRLRRGGTIIVTDRYPQTEVVGFYDGPGLSAARPKSYLVAALARREARMYAWMASFHPDVVIRLNVDLDTAHARKPDHKYDLLRQKVDATSRLRFAGAPIADLDSTEPYHHVLICAEQVVRNALAQQASRPEY